MADVVTLRFSGTGGSVSFARDGRRVLLRPGQSIEVSADEADAMLAEYPLLVRVDPVAVAEPEPVVVEPVVVAVVAAPEPEPIQEPEPEQEPEPAKVRPGTISITDLTDGGRKRGKG